MEINETRLKEKGWSDYEIHHALDILVEADEKKHPRIKLIDQLVYWLFLFLAVGGNVAFSIALLPLIVTLNNTMLYFITAFMALIFGTLCTTLLKMIDFIDTHHHVLYIILVPVSGVVNFAIIVNQANKTIENLGIGTIHDPFTLGLLYLSAFFLPYAVFYRNGDFEWT